MTATLQTTEAAGGDQLTQGTGRRLGVRNVVRSLTSSPQMIVGVVLLLIFVLAAILGPVLIQSPDALVGTSLQAPSLKFPLGTTQSGQSVFSQLIVSAQGTLIVGFGAGIIATVVALVIGVGGAFIGGFADDVLNLITNIFLVIPTLPLIIIVSADLNDKGYSTTVLVIAITSWAGGARVLRGLTLSMRSRDYVLAARVSGERTWRIVLVEVLPNLTAFILSSFIFSVIFAMLTQAGLAFIGLESPSSATWGNMLYFAQNSGALSSGAWWWFVPPGLCIALVGTALTLINLGLDVVINPKLKVGRRTGRKSRQEIA
jgi:peptide/nickel transport system permease protein